MTKYYVRLTRVHLDHKTGKKTKSSYVISEHATLAEAENAAAPYANREDVSASVEEAGNICWYNYQGNTWAI